MRLTSRLADHEHGASMIEFAIVLPLFLLLIGGMVDLGRACYTEVMLTNAAREGARSAMYGPDGYAARATAGLGGGVKDATVGGSPCTAGATSGTTKITVTAPFQWDILGPAMNLVTFGAGDALPDTLTGEATMQCGG